jgi:hypothetical protein
MDLVFQLIFTIMGAFLSVTLTIILVQNGRQIRMLSEKMEVLCEKMGALVRRWMRGSERLQSSSLRKETQERS